MDNTIIEWWVCDENGMPLYKYEGFYTAPSPDLSIHLVALPSHG
jgi:hypothetical protein